MQCNFFPERSNYKASRLSVASKFKIKTTNKHERGIAPKKTSQSKPHKPHVDGETSEYGKPSYSIVNTV